MLAEFAAAAKIQAMVRRFLSKFLRLRQWKKACRDADRFYVAKVERKKQAVSNRRAAQEMHTVFVRTYVSDLLQTGRVFILQNYQVVKIQRLYRGYLVRRIFSFTRLFERRKRKPPTNKRVTAEMARRVWARTEFAPAGGGWPNGVDKQRVLEYDMNEYADKPPGGRDFGLKTFKVVASARNAREERVLVRDPAAWVGIPVLVEPRKVWLRRERERKTQLMLLHSTTPYLEHRTVERKPKPRAQGVAALRELGWRKDMVDKELEVLPRAQRASYSLINPLDTHQVADIMDGMFRPEALHKRMQDPSRVTGAGSSPSKRQAARSFAALRLKNQNPTLGGLSTESQFSLPTQASASASAVLPPSPEQQSPVRLGWTSANINANSIVLPAADPEESQRLQSLGLGSTLLQNSNSRFTKVTRLVTPLRGAIKPLPRAHKEALEQHSLLPSQVQRAAKRAQAQGFEDPHWSESAWGQIKRRAEALAHGEQGLAEARARDEEGTFTLSDALQKQLTTDPWTRALYRPTAPVPCRIEAFPVRRKQHFKVRYSWLPQPLVGNAAANVINDARDVSRRSYDPPAPATAEDSADEDDDDDVDGDLGEPSAAHTLGSSSFVTQIEGSETLASLASTHSPKKKKKRPPGTPAKHPYPFHA